MKTIFKYIFASVFTGLCAVAYQATKRQNVFTTNSLQSTEIIAPIAPVASKQSENALALRAQARQNRILMSEQQARVDAENIVSTISPTYQVIDQPVGHTPASVAQEVTTVALQPNVATPPAASSSIPFPVSSASDRSPVTSYQPQSVPSHQTYEGPIGGYDQMFYPEQQFGYPSMQHNVSDTNMEPTPGQIDHEPAQAVTEAPVTMQKVINPEQSAYENNEGRFMARKHKSHRRAATTVAPTMPGHQYVPQSSEEMVQENMLDGQAQIAAPSSWMSYLGNGLGFLGTAALAYPAAALGYLGAFASRFGNMFRSTPVTTNGATPLTLTNDQSVGMRALALTQRAGAAVYSAVRSPLAGQVESSDALTSEITVEKTPTNSVGTLSLNRYVPTWSQVGYVAMGIAALSAAVYGAGKFNAYRSNAAAEGMMMNRVSQAFNQYVSSSAGSSPLALAGTTPEAQGWLAAGYQSIAAQFARIGATGRLR